VYKNILLIYVYLLKFQFNLKKSLLQIQILNITEAILLSVFLNKNMLKTKIYK